MSDDRPTLERAVALARAGDGAAARREAEAALAADPGNGGLLHFLGTLHCQAGAFAEGAGYFRRVVERDPDASAARADLARALLALGQSEEALLACATGGPELRRLEGQILQSLGRDAEAAAAYEQVVGQMPRDWEIWNNLGNTRQALGDAAGAVAALEEAARIRPDVLPIQVNFGAALAAAGQLEEALRAYSAALTLAPAELPIRLEAARLQRQLGRGEAALQLLENAPAGAEVAVERARSLTALRRLDAAEQAYREAIGARPGWAEAYLELGIALERSGRVEALAPLLAEAAAQGVAAEALSYLHALLLQSQGRVEEALEWAQRAPPALEPVRTQRLISRLAAQAGQSALAFAAAGRANALAARDWRAALERAAAYRAHVGRLTQIVTDSWVARWTPPVPAGERPSPVFLVGFPRSGTTLLDTILMGHGQTHVLEEIPLLERVMAQVGGMERLADLDAAEIGRLREVYFASLDETAPPPLGATVIDKLPLNILGAPLIHRLFPDARFIFALRHPCDVALSCFTQGFELNDAMANFLEIEATAELYDKVMTFWQRCRDTLPLRVFELRYENLVADAEGAVRPLLKFLGLEWDPTVLDHRRTAAARGVISTPSYNQVTQRLYRHASGRWSAYREQLAPALPLLLPWARRFGYSD